MGSLEVVVIGGTGAIGRCVMCDLIKSTAVRRITMLNRRQVDDLSSCPGALKKAEEDGKVVQRVVDMDHMEKHAEDFGTPDAAIMCLGTTRKDAGSAEKFKAIDYGYAMKFATICKEKNVRTYALVSAMNANAKSFFLYPQVKGQIEEDTKKLGFPRLLIYRPGLLDRGGDARGVESLAMMFIGGIPVQTIGTAIVYDVTHEPEQPREIEYFKDADMKRTAKAATENTPQ